MLEEVDMVRIRKGDVLVSKAQAAAMIGVGRRTINRWVQFGKFPTPIRIGTHIVRWYRRDVLKWIRNQKEMS